MAFHTYVQDTDTVYGTALDGVTTPLQAPADQPWGERTANVRDACGNHWYIATFQGENYFSDGAILHATLKIGDAAMEMSEAGATSTREPSDHEYGDRTAAVMDPSGNKWYLAAFAGREGK